MDIDEAERRGRRLQDRVEAAFAHTFIGPQKTGEQGGQIIGARADEFRKRVAVLLALAEEKAEKRLRFSPEGEAELAALHARVLRNMALASNILVSNDVESARLLLGEKDEMRRLHRASRKKHLNRLSEGRADSLESSDIHLETASALKEFNSQITLVAYPILFREGQLLETRLIGSLPRDEQDSSG